MAFEFMSSLNDVVGHGVYYTNARYFMFVLPLLFRKSTINMVE